MAGTNVGKFHIQATGKVKDGMLVLRRMVDGIPDDKKIKVAGPKDESRDAFMGRLRKQEPELTPATRRRIADHLYGGSKPSDSTLGISR